MADETVYISPPLQRAYRALAALEEKAAGYGSLEIPVSLKLELEDKRREVAELEKHSTLVNEKDLSQWRVVLKRYFNDLIKRYGTIQIFGQPKPVSLEGIFTHVRFLSKPSALRRYDLHQLQIQDSREIYDLILAGNSGEPDGAISGLDLVKNFHSDRLLILGRPGAGKTTFLKHLALQASQGYLEKIPILLTLREWGQVGNHTSLMNFIIKQFTASGVRNPSSIVEYLLTRTDLALMLFDGLDEIPYEGSQREEAIMAIREFVQLYPNVQVVVTCRIAAVDYTFEGFRYLEIADFNDEQMHAFVCKWFDNMDIAKQFWKELNQPENRGLYELGQTPLLLTILSLAYTETLSFPHRQADLYTEALEALLKKWDSSRKIRRDRIYRELSPVRKQQMLARLGAQAFEIGEYVMPKEVLTKRISAYLKSLPRVTDESVPTGDAVLSAIEAQHGILVERAHNLYTFAHLTFQEYYTARYIVDNARYGTLKKLLYNHSTDARWREVILLTVSLLDKAEDFFVHFLNVMESIISSDAITSEFIIWSASKVMSVDLPYKPASIRAYYIWLVLGIANISASDVALDLARTLDPAFDVALDYDLALDRSLVIYYFRTRDLLSQQPTYTGQGLSKIIKNARDQELSDSFERIQSLNIAMAKELQLTEFAMALSALKAPTVKDEADRWRKFTIEFEDILYKYRGIICAWDFKEDQVAIFARYFYAAQLFIECLNLAAVSNRDTIVNRLFLPPNAKKLGDVAA